MVTNQQCRVSGTYNGGSLMKCLVINTMPWDALFSTKWVLLVCVLPSGRIPQGLFNSTPNLSEICLGSNRLTEAIPDSACPRKKNSSSMPPSLFNISQLQALSVGRNNLSGPIPGNESFHVPMLQMLILQKPFQQAHPFSTFYVSEPWHTLSCCE